MPDKSNKYHQSKYNKETSLMSPLRSNEFYKMNRKFNQLNPINTTGLQDLKTLKDDLTNNIRMKF